MHPTSELWILLGQIGVALSVLGALYRGVRYSANRLNMWMEAMEKSRAEESRQMREAMLNELRQARREIESVKTKVEEMTEAVNGHASE